MKACYQKQFLSGLILEIGYFSIIYYMQLMSMIIFSPVIIFLGFLIYFSYNKIIIVIFTLISLLDICFYLLCLYFTMFDPDINTRITSIFIILIISLKSIKVTAALDMLENN